MLGSLTILFLGLAALLGSGILFCHRRVLTYLSVAGVLFEAQWLLLTWLVRTTPMALNAEWMFFGGAITLLALWAGQYKSWRFPYGTSVGSGRRDLVIALVLLITIGAAWSVTRVNGFQGINWVSHGFYNGDVATFGALVQRSLLTDSLVRENPFAANDSLEYPTLLHAGIAELLTRWGVSENWLHFLPVMTYLQIMVTIPLFFLLFDLVEEKLNESGGLLLVQGLGALYVLMLSWDNYIYPQSHFFLTAMFLLQVALLVKTGEQRGLAGYLAAGMALVVGMLLLLSNAVTGTAAVVTGAVFAVMRMANKKRTVAERMIFGLALAGLIVVFWLATPGNGLLGWPGFSYTAALDMLRLAPIVIAILLVNLWPTVRWSFLHIAGVALVGLGLLTYFFSTRDIVVENASRFFYHAILITFPLLLAPSVQFFYWLRRQLFYVSRGVVEQVAVWGSVGAISLFLLLPAGASVASAHDNLWRKDEQTVSATERMALWWIEDNTAPKAIFAASPKAPFAIPFFTGRALLRADYWLSPDDLILDDLKAAMAGNKPAQEKVLSHVNYLMLSAGERQQWEPLPLRKVFDNTSFVIYNI